MAIFVSVVGLVSLLALFSQSVVLMYLVQDDLVAKQKARETMESIYSARNTAQLTFDSIQNEPAGIFLSGFQPLRYPNPSSGGGDGLVGTADDGDIETLNKPGPDGELGTGDDLIRTLDNYERQILIEPVLMADSNPYPDLRKITVTVRFSTDEGLQRSFAVSSFVSRYR